MQKSGSLTRGFTVGTNRDLSLSSGFRMQLAGRIASDVEVAASLTDENTPIQPEGTTQTLQEFDNVFVEIKSPSYAATLGDFVLDMHGTEFARLTRKLQGARGTAVLQGESVSGEALVSGAVTRGQFQTNAFQGSEGVQGPYRLTGRGGERSMIVIAGTEKVYINGELQLRGETNDYVIDYTTGEVRFAIRRLITAASRIVVDFEYADRRYSRSLAAVRAGGSILDGRGNISVAYLREADDPDAPIDLVLSDSARRVLAAAGGDPSRAVLNGVTRVDSNGQYLRMDSILADGRTVTFYRFDPGNSAALYNVTFSFVGTGHGDYVRRRPGEFAWTAPGGGDYLPVILLPFAQSQQVIDIRGIGGSGRCAHRERRICAERAGCEPILHGGPACGRSCTECCGNLCSAEPHHRRCRPGRSRHRAPGSVCGFPLHAHRPDQRHRVRSHVGSGQRGGGRRGNP
jgi:hypothetical protein